MSGKSWSTGLIMCLVCGIFIFAGIYIPKMPVAGRVLWVVMPSIFIILIATPMVRSLGRELQQESQPTRVDVSKSTETPVKRYMVACPPDRGHYEIKDEQGILMLRVNREKGDPDETPVGTIKQALGSMFLDNLPIELTKYAFELTYSKFVFEATDGKRQGIIQRKMMKYVVYDTQGDLMATIKPIELVEGLICRIDDPQGRRLAESDDVVTSLSYRILSPMGVVIADVYRSGSGNMNINNIYVFDPGFDPFLIYCYVIAVDNVVYWQQAMSGWNRS